MTFAKVSLRLSSLQAKKKKDLFRLNFLFEKSFLFYCREHLPA